MNPYQDLAQELFQAYNDQGPNPWKTHDGKPVPPWNELSEQVQAKWTAVAFHVIERWAVQQMRSKADEQREQEKRRVLYETLKAEFEPEKT